MNNDLKKILFKLEKNGFEAYIVGGYVRDYLLGIESIDVDICTNALPKDIIEVFKIKKGVNNYGSISFNYGKYNLDITTYRKEFDYNNHKPKHVEYVNNLLIDLQRRDFTINTLCMNRDGKVFDYLHGKDDLNARVINIVGNVNQKLLEDPLRMLRAIRFSIILDFKISTEIKEFIINNKNLIRMISYDRRKMELDKIFSSKNVMKGLALLKELNVLDVLDINYSNVVYTSDIIGMWAQIDFSSEYRFNKNTIESINSLRQIIKNGYIDETILLNNDLYFCLVAGEILGLGRNYINSLYKNMPIHKESDLKISVNDIMLLFNEKWSSKINEIYNDVLNKILNRELKNNKRVIKKYILKTWM